MPDAATEVPGWRESAIYEEWPATEDTPRRWKCRHCGGWDGRHGHIGHPARGDYRECPYRGAHGYERFEPDNTDSPITHEQALDGINRIRNSIIGAQNINWSEHIYPLVSLLNRAGYEGLDYPEAKANIGIVLDRIAAAEALLRDTDWLLARLSFSTVTDEDHDRAYAIARQVREAAAKIGEFA